MNNLSLMFLIRVALKKLHIIVIASLLCSVIVFGYCNYIAVPQYSAKGSIIVTNGSIITGGDIYEDNVNNTSSTVNNTDISASLSLANTVEGILGTTNGIYKDVAESIGNKYTYSQLMSRSSVSRRDDRNLFIDIEFTADSPEEAKELVNAFLTFAPEYITEIIPNSTTAIVSTADKSYQIYPRTLMSSALAALLGAAITYMILYIIAITNTRIKNEEDIKNNYSVTIIGNIPDFATANSKGYYKYNSYAKGDSTNGKQ